MSSCKNGDKPTIKYKFAGQPEKIYKCDVAPIEVITKTVPIRSSENYEYGGFGITVWSVDSGKFLSGISRDYEIFQNPENGEFVFTSRGCNDKYFLLGYETYQSCVDAKINFMKCRQGFTIDPSKKISIDKSVTCEVPLSEKCSIQVLHKNSVFFQFAGQLSP